MKDLPHHMKKLNRQVVRSERKLEQEDADYAATIPSPPQHTPRPKKQLRKQAKEKMKQERNARIPVKKTIEERNNEMKHRVPQFDRDSKERPKEGAHASKKKMPRI